MSYLINLLSINIGRKMGNHTSQDMNGNIRMSPGSKWNVMQGNQVHTLGCSICQFHYLTDGKTDRCGTIVFPFLAVGLYIGKSSDKFKNDQLTQMNSWEGNMYDISSVYVLPNNL